MKTRTLFVEDERWGVNHYFYELEKNQFECVLAKNGDEAIDKLQTEIFDLVSMDIMFPPGQIIGQGVLPIRAGMKLLEMIRNGNIKNCNPKIKVIILTALIDHEIESSIRKMGVSAYLKKPIEFAKVIQTFCNLKNKEE